MEGGQEYKTIPFKKFSRLKVNISDRRRMIFKTFNLKFCESRDHVMHITNKQSNQLFLMSAWGHSEPLHGHMSPKTFTLSLDFLI